MESDHWAYEIADELAKKFVTLIITKDDPMKLKRVLISIKNNNFLFNSEILIIDNSNKIISRNKNKGVILDFSRRNILYIDKLIWEGIKIVINKRTKDSHIKNLLENISLSTIYWDIHQARNVAAIICAVVYGDSDLIICLDDDMVIPKGFSFHKNNIRHPMGIPLKGGPDLSRLEWIRLYNKSQDPNLTKSNSKDYISNLVNNFPKDSIKNIIKTYTNILESKKSEELLTFPRREELNAGSFISPLGEIATQLYPNWFDNDWFWFNRHKKNNNYNLKFINSPIIHLSSKKDIFNKKFLEFEEVGKIIIRLLKDKIPNYILKEREVKKEIEKRKEIIKNEMEIAKEISSKIKNKKEKLVLLKISSNLKFLYKFLCSIKISYIKDQIYHYEKNNRYWNKLIKEIKKPGTFRLELFRLLNQREFLIFSPHCDDVAFSLGGTIINNYLKNVTVYTIYTKTNYYLNKPKEINNISKARLSEEIKFLDRIGASYKFFSFDDSAERYSSEKEYMAPSNNPREDSSFIKLKNVINKIVKRKRNKGLLFPLGVGYNIDHRILFEIGRNLIKDGYLVLFYEDVGYKMTEKDNLIKDYLKGNFPELVSRTFFFSNIKDKSKLCKIYKTQISKDLMENITKIAKNRKGERIWSTMGTFKALNL